mgnify:CR=1 FL=1
MKNILSLVLFTFLCFATANAQNNQMPKLVKNGNITQMIVDGKPFIMLAGELHNSSTGSAHYMAPIWQRMSNKNLNTVIAAVSWELIEPQENQFDFALVDSMINGARRANLKLVVLWFGSWKNGASTYVPSWVKKDPKRFPLASYKGGDPMTTLSTLGKNSMEADAKAFAALMGHIKEVDSSTHTVVMMQVENEMGTEDFSAAFMQKENRSMRDFSPAADKAFNSEVPQQLISYLKANKQTLHPAIAKVWNDNDNKMKGTWEEVFGKGKKADSKDWQNEYPYLTEEIFNAWNYAKYVEYIAAKGKEVYPLPMYVNAWIKQGGEAEPGTYPSGGPQAHVQDIWRAAAPHIDLIAPDIYAMDLLDWVCSGYTHNGNPLFIPETRSSSDGAARSFYTIGRYNALCYSPFGIDGGGLSLTADPNDFSYNKAYAMLKNLTPYIHKYAGTKEMSGLLMDKNRLSDKINMGKYKISILPFSTRASIALAGVAVEEIKQTDTNVAGLIIFQTGENEFVVAGGIGGMVVNISKNETSKAKHVALLSTDEITFDKEGHELLHRLNGDETSYGSAVIPIGTVKAFRIKMYEY